MKNVLALGFCQSKEVTPSFVSGLCIPPCPVYGLRMPLLICFVKTPLCLPPTVLPLDIFAEKKC